LNLYTDLMPSFSRSGKLDMCYIPARQIYLEWDGQRLGLSNS